MITLAESGLKKPDYPENLRPLRDESDRSSRADPAVPAPNQLRSTMKPSWPW